MDEISHNLEKLIKSAENVEFEYERHIYLIMGLVRQVDEAGALIKDKYGLINQLETKVQDPEKENHHIEATVTNKAMQAMYCMKVHMRISYAKVDKEDNHFSG